MSASSFGESNFDNVEFDMEGGSYIRIDKQMELKKTEKANQINSSESECKFGISKNDD